MILDHLFLPRHAVSQVLLRGSLLLGAAIDAVLAALLVLAPELPARWLGLTLPKEPLVLWLFSLSLLFLAAMYVLPAYDVMAYSGNILVAILGRLAGGGVLLFAALERPDPMAFYGVAAVEIGLAVAHAGLWLPGRHGPAI